MCWKEVHYQILEFVICLLICDSSVFVSTFFRNLFGLKFNLCKINLIGLFYVFIELNDTFHCFTIFFTKIGNPFVRHFHLGFRSGKWNCMKVEGWQKCKKVIWLSKEILKHLSSLFSSKLKWGNFTNRQIRKLCLPVPRLPICAHLNIYVCKNM